MKKIIILPFAEEDIKASVDFYADAGEELKIRFVEQLNNSFRTILKNPYACPKVKNQIRKFILSDFPFNIYFIDQTEALYILAVFHTMRNPKIWKSRKF